MFENWLRARQSAAADMWRGRQPGGLTPLEQFIYEQKLKADAEADRGAGAGSQGNPPSNLDRSLPPGSAPRGPAGAPASGEPTPNSDKRAGLTEEEWRRIGPNPPVFKPPVVEMESILDEIDESRVPGLAQRDNADPKTPDSSAVTIVFKATPWAIASGSDATNTLAQFNTMLVTDKPEKPFKTARSRAAEEAGSDKAPVHCVTNQKGLCAARVAADDLASFGLAPGAQRHLVVVKAYKTSSVVIRQTPGAAKQQIELPAGVLVSEQKITIGKNEFSRLDIVASEADTALVIAAYGKAYGTNLQKNPCGSKEPGPPLNKEPTAFNACDTVQECS